MMKKAANIMIGTAAALALSTSAFAAGTGIIGGVVRGAEDIAEGVLHGAESVVDGARNTTEDILGAGEDIIRGRDAGEDDMPNDDTTENEVLDDTHNDEAPVDTEGETATTTSDKNPSTGVDLVAAVAATAASMTAVATFTRKRR